MIFAPMWYKQTENELRVLLSDIIFDIQNGKNYNIAIQEAHTKIYQVADPSYTRAVDLVNVQDEITAAGNIENFKLGFRLGVQMICDSLVFNENKIFRDIIGRNRRSLEIKNSAEFVAARKLLLEVKK